MSLPGRDTLMPSVGKRYLGKLLRDLREEAGLTLVEAGRQVGCGKTKIQRWETGQWSRGYASDMRPMLEVYRTPPHITEELVRLMKIAKHQRGWWDGYSDVFRGAYPSFEYEVSQSFAYSGMHVPGLLQTPEYIEAITRATGLYSKDTVQRRIEAREQRRTVFKRDPEPEFALVIEEVALDRFATIPEVYHPQIEHLIEVVEGSLPVTIQLLPLSAGPHAALGGHFVLMDFAGDFDLSIVYTEGGAYQQYVEESDMIAKYRKRFTMLSGVALSERDSIARLKDKLKN